MSLLRNITKVMLDQMIAIEFSNGDQVDEDIAVKILEQTAANLLALDSEEITKLDSLLMDISKEYDLEEHRDFAQSVLENFGVKQL